MQKHTQLGYKARGIENQHTTSDRIHCMQAARVEQRQHTGPHPTPAVNRSAETHRILKSH